jgi:hypothetical protein
MAVCSWRGSGIGERPRRIAGRDVNDISGNRVAARDGLTKHLGKT